MNEMKGEFMTTYITESLEMAAKFYSLSLRLAKAGDFESAMAHAKWGEEQVNSAQEKFNAEYQTITNQKKGE